MKKTRLFIIVLAVFAASALSAAPGAGQTSNPVGFYITKNKKAYFEIYQTGQVFAIRVIRVTQDAYEMYRFALGKTLVDGMRQEGSKLVWGGGTAYSWKSGKPEGQAEAWIELLPEEVQLTFRSGILSTQVHLIKVTEAEARGPNAQNPGR